MTAIAATSVTATDRRSRDASTERPFARLTDFEPVRAAGRGFDPAIAASALALNLLGLALPLAVLQIYDKISAAQAVETLAFLGVGLVVVALLEFGLRLVQSYSLAVDAHRLGYRVATDAAQRQLALAGRGGARESAAVTMEKFRALDAIAAYASGDQRRDLIDLPFSAVFLLAIAAIGGALVLVPIAVIAVAVLVAWILLRRSRALADARDQGARRRADFLGEFFAGLPTIKGLGSEPLMLRRFERLAAGSAVTFRDNFAAASDLQIAVAAFSSVGVAAMMGVGAVFVISGDLSAGGLAACSLLSSRAIQPLVRSVGAVAERQKALIAAETARSLFEGEPAPIAQPTTPSPGPEEGALSVEAEGVTYAAGARTVLDEACFFLPAGEIAALNAPSTEDAQSFLRVLAGLHRPDAGALTLSGCPADFARMRPGAVVVVTPGTKLFRGTIMENLTLFGAMADTHYALWAMRLLGAERLVGALPAGYDTMVNAGAGDSLSQAHLREIVLARAFAQRPGLLLLDQPHLYLDPDSEQRLYKALSELRGRVTTVIRSDRAAAAAIAQHRFQLREGWFSAQRSPAAAETGEAAS